MTKSTRWVLLFLAVTIFVCVGGITVVYALGYQYDFETARFLRNGSFRVVANVDADVYINGKPSGSTSFIGKTFSKSNTLPKTYAVELKKESYRPWKKNIKVEAGLFTDFPKIFLVPASFSEDEVFAKFASPSLVPTRKLKGKVAEFDGKNLCVTWLDNTDYQPFHSFGDRELILKVPAPITQIAWVPDNNHIIYLSAGTLWFTEIDPRGGLNSYEITTWPL